MSAIDTQVAGNHYKNLPIQPIEFILANGLGFCEANAIKYLCRYKDKGGATDLEKAKHYIDLLLESLNKKGPKTRKPAAEPKPGAKRRGRPPKAAVAEPTPVVTE